VATEIGIIKTLIGTAVAVVADGSQRILQAGDRVYQNEVISTGPAGAVEVEFSGGSIMALGRNSQTLLDAEIVDSQAISIPSDEVNVDAVQQALLDGADPSQVTAVTAAGAGAAGAGNEGVDIVKINHEAPVVTPDSGFETTGINVVFDEREEEDEISQGLNPPIDFDADVIADYQESVVFGYINNQEVIDDNVAILGEDLDLGPGYIYEFQVGEAEGIADNIHGTDIEDGVTSSFTISSLPTDSDGNQVGLLLIDRNDDGSLDEIYGESYGESYGSLPVGGLAVSSGDSIFYFQSSGANYDGESLQYYEQGAMSSVPVSVSFNYSTIDSDELESDGAVINIGFAESDDNPEVFEQSLIAVDEDGLVLGTPGGEDDVSGEVVSVDGTLNYGFGDDGAGDVDFSSLDGQVVHATGDGGLQSLTSQGNAVTYVWNAATHTLTGVANTAEEGAYDVFSLEVTNIDTGAYTFTLLAPVDHPAADTEDDLVLDFPFTVSDFDGDTAAGSLQVTIDDDSPVVTPGEPTEFVYELTITNHDEVSSAGYHSSYGYYVKGEGGIPTTGLVIWDDVHDADALETVVVVGYSPEQIGFFIIPNGDSLNSALSDNTEIEFVQLPTGDWQAVIPGSPSVPLLGAGTNVMFDDDALNPIDNSDHVQDNELIGNQNWEDLAILTGDGDYNDVNVNVEWTLISEISGEPNIDFGADGPRFSGEISVTSDDGAITSSGQDIIFTLEDINHDGKLDLVGSTGGSSDALVLTVDDILSGDEPLVELFGPIDSPNGNVTVSVEGALTDGDGDSAVQFNVNVELLLAQQEASDAA